MINRLIFSATTHISCGMQFAYMKCKYRIDFNEIIENPLNLKITLDGQEIWLQKQPQQLQHLLVLPPLPSENSYELIQTINKCNCML